MQIVLIGENDHDGEKLELPMEITRDGRIIFTIKGKAVSFNLKDFDDSEAFLKAKLPKEV